MRLNSKRVLLVMLLCLSSAVVQSQTTPIAAGVTGDAASAGRAHKKKAVKHPIAQSPDANCAAASARTTVRGIDASGNPYVETVDPDGTRRHRTRGRVTITSPNGQESTVLQANAQAPTAPPLPTTPESGRAWFDQHNAALLALISQTVNGDATALKSFSAREMQATSGDTLKQIYFRTDALQFLAGAQ